MITLKIYHVNAFASGPFSGNPAAVIPLDFWISDDLLQKIASQNNLSETAFFVKSLEGFHIRWFTPKTEVALCGHATLASAFVLFEILKIKNDLIVFESKSGPLFVNRNKNKINLNFPSQSVDQIEAIPVLEQGLGHASLKTFKAGDDVLLIYPNENIINCLSPDFGILDKVDVRGIIVSSISQKYDFVCRFFAPKVGINEDPVTGSAFTKLIPYWSNVLNKTQMNACQISERRGDVSCELLGDRVLIGGVANCYLIGEVYV